MNTLRWLGIALVVFGLAFMLFAIFGEQKKNKRGEHEW